MTLWITVVTLPAMAWGRSALLPPSVPTEAYRALRSLPTASIIPAIRLLTLAQHDQHLCLALALYHEARDAETDRLAVAHVIYNRMHDSGLSVCATVWEDNGSQFQWVKRTADLIPREISVWQAIQTKVMTFMQRPTKDMTHGATHFYNAALVSPAWAHAGQMTIKLRHTFIRLDERKS